MGGGRGPRRRNTDASTPAGVAACGGVAAARREQVLKYFSYEHFYVIYCKFWELDTDHDFLLDASDLAKYSQCALSFQIIERIFAQVRSAAGRGRAGRRHAPAGVLRAQWQEGGQLGTHGAAAARRKGRAVALVWAVVLAMECRCRASSRGLTRTR